MLEDNTMVLLHTPVRCCPSTLSRSSIPLFPRCLRKNPRSHPSPSRLPKKSHPVIASWAYAVLHGHIQSCLLRNLTLPYCPVRLSLVHRCAIFLHHHKLSRSTLLTSPNPNVTSALSSCISIDSPNPRYYFTLLLSSANEILRIHVTAP